jgi:Domain of unknown function (DUF4388)
VSFMQPPRETVTDSLAAIIQIIHLGYQSGTLTVERGEGKTFEEGMLVFTNGRVSEARVGQFVGLPAFNTLTTWQACRFSFQNTPHTPPQGLPPLSSYERATPASKNGQQDTTPLASFDHQYKQALPATSLSVFPVRRPFGDAALQHADNASLPRMHRRLLLLINGQRNANELARLLGRSPEETHTLLNELEHAGLIQQ